MYGWSDGGLGELGIVVLCLRFVSLGVMKLMWRITLWVTVC
jgi:hypothetical protein